MNDKELVKKIMMKSHLHILKLIDIQFNMIKKNSNLAFLAGLIALAALALILLN